MVRLVNPAAGTLGAGVTAAKTRHSRLTRCREPTGPWRSWSTTRPDGIGGAEDDPRPPRDDFTPVTVGGVTEDFSELPDEGSTEVWEFLNPTVDAHPIHMHLIQFQLRTARRSS